MARGDVIGSLQTINASSSYTVQPGSGVEWVIKCFGGDNGDTNLIEAYDGTSGVIILRGLDAESTGGQLTFPINNSLYARLRNSNSGGAGRSSYHGYITKD